MSDLNNDERDSLIATIVENLTEKAQSGQPVDINAALDQHPDIATELREIWGTLMIANAVAPSSAASDGHIAADTF